MPSGKSGDSGGPSSTAAMLLNPKVYKSQLSKKQNQSATSSAPSNTSRFDPKALLNPRGTSAQLPTSSTSAPVVDKENTANIKRPFSGLNQLEQLYGVEDRSKVAPKRMKMTSNKNDDEERKGTTFHVPSTDGPIGAYMKEDEKTEQHDFQQAIDLTADDDDDDVVVTGERSLEPALNYDEEEVCLGRIVEAKVEAHMIPQPPKSSLAVLDPSKWNPIACQLHRNTDARDLVIHVTDSASRVFGCLDKWTARGLSTMMDRLVPSRQMRLQARVPIRTRMPGEVAGQPINQLIPCWINVYAIRRLVRSIGRFLGQNNVFLSRPLGIDSGKEIINPHDDPSTRRALAGLPASSAAKTGVQADYRTVEEATNAVSKMFDALSSTSENLSQMEPHPSITTALLTHQKQGLDWLLRKERPRTFGNVDEDSHNSSLWRMRLRSNGSKEYKEIVSGISQPKEPPEVFGGLLADVMGLGKTIEILALLASTQEEAQHFALQKVQKLRPDERNFRCHSKATLLIVPLSTVQNWESQIREHVKAGTFSVHIYHGQNRATSSDDLAQYDIVITTYGTVASEAARTNALFYSLLFQIKWFRIVLDEAHTIREPKAKQSLAIYELWGQRRWAVTGTPIQNRIEDLGSLLRFLRLYPYDSTQGFTQYIRAPLRKSSPHVLTSLRVLIGSVSLRRLKDKIDLPQREDFVVKLNFTQEERKIHDFFKGASQAKLNKLNGAKQKKGNVANLHVLQGISTLRMISAAGQDLLNEQDRARLSGSYEKQAIDLEGPDIPSSEVTDTSAMEMFTLMQNSDIDFCSVCDRALSGDSPRDDDPDHHDQPFGFFLACYDLLCRECFQSRQREFQDAANDSAHHQVSCPACGVQVPSTIMEITQKNLDEYQAGKEASKQKKKSKSKNYSGPSTKTQALLKDLVQMGQDSLDHLDKGEPPVKAVVYSEFTSHLDILECALRDENYLFVRIDGSMPLVQRRKVLDRFSIDSKIMILLASVKAAGQGLNLTAASRVFIMEPLWNPAAEQQAVDRIHRLGQTRAVRVTRFIIKDSVEEAVLKLQQKKIKLASLSMDRGKGLSKKQSQEETAKLLSEVFK
ncbi:MAG: hypothetical protein Q9227_001521 [Pyrenula ochraceoflavens]